MYLNPLPNTYNELSRTSSSDRELDPTFSASSPFHFCSLALMLSPLSSVYQGSKRKLVMAFDIGTTFSGVSYSILDPGRVPDIKNVTRFPSQNGMQKSSKVPTVIYYDPQGNVAAVGAETAREGIELDAKEGDWFEAKWFKLHLHPGAASSLSTYDLPPLPPNKSVTRVISDFLRYLFDCASQYIKESTFDGHNLWKSVEKDIDFVLSHPNGWAGKEQQAMRRASVLAGFIPDNQADHDRISFVTEGEASLHFAFHAGILSGVQEGEGIVVVDAGGGTIDVSSYRQDPGKKKAVFDEIATSQSRFHGSVFINMNAKSFLRRFLKESQFFDDIEHITRCFDQTTKLRFNNDKNSHYVKFGSVRDNDVEHNIQLGQLKLEGTDIAGFFQDSETVVIQTVLEQRSSSTSRIKHVVFVGGFSASDWLFEKVSSLLKRTHSDLKILRPEEKTHKAVSDGAVSFYLHHLVRSRFSKLTYGSICCVPYKPKDPEHKLREAGKRLCLSGEEMISDRFVVILPKNKKATEEEEFRAQFRRTSERLSDFRKFSALIWCYRGELEDPRWEDQDAANFVRLCSVEADLSHLHLGPTKNRSGKIYYQVNFDVILLLGLTELKAQIAWKEKGGEKRSRIKIIYEKDFKL